MKFSILSVEDYEMVHYSSLDLFIAHKGNIITYKQNDKKQIINMPGELKLIEKVAMNFRKSRRLLRLDKAIILPTEEYLILFRRSEIWRYSLEEGMWEKSDIKLNCRNPMYNGVLRIPNGDIYVGEYGNPSEEGKRIIKSTDQGLSWRCVYTFKPNEIRHIHCIAWDSFEEKIWVFTGDSDNECKVLCCDREFMDMEIVGSGSQAYRSCHAMFSKKSVDWIMDSPLEKVRYIKLDRKTRKISHHSSFDGPVWFAQRFRSGVAIAVSVQEVGTSHTDKKLHLYTTVDMESWEEVASFKHDGWPKRYFRFGTICISRGEMKDNCFYIFCEGVKGFDGKTILCKIVDL